MAQDKQLSRIERKLDALLEEQGIDPAGFGEQETATRAAPRELTAAEQQAIDNAPRAEATVPPQQSGPRITQQNAPDTSSSVPKAPSDAVGSVTVETEQPDGKTTVQTEPAGDTKKGKK